MPTANDSTTLICLFHHENQAEAALADLTSAGVPASSISVIGGQNRQGTGASSLEGLGVPERDLNHLRDGLSAGGTIVSVSAISDHVSIVERIFGEHRATKIDEAVTDDDSYAAPLAAAATVGTAVAGETAIPIVEEELQVGKRTVDQGGVRVYKRIVEVPVEESVSLREEHVVVERNAVNRPATQADLDAQGTRSIELTETAEEAVVGKNARVVEEVLVGKQTGERTEHIQDTVRRTEVEVEELEPTNLRNTTTKTGL